MTSMFDTRVRERREATPWARVDVKAFMQEMALEGGLNPDAPEVTLTCRYRPDVASRLWWTLEWTGEDGQRHTAGSQDFRLLLWRAAEAEMQARARSGREGNRADH